VQEVKVVPVTQPEVRLARKTSGGSVPLQLLIVDDDCDVRESLATLLESEGARVREAADVPAALRVLDEWTPDVMIVDIQMPGMSGYDLVRAVRGRDATRSVPAIALTGNATVTDRITALTAGFTTHLTKPVEPTALITAVASLAGSR
jgi:hypothetical protein